jgi:hypothetical protein
MVRREKVRGDFRYGAHRRIEDIIDRDLFFSKLLSLLRRNGENHARVIQLLVGIARTVGAIRK